MSNKKFSYRTKIEKDLKTENFLLDFSTLMNKVEKDLYVKLLDENNELNDLKIEFLLKYKISSRQFNSVHKMLVGKINSIKALQKRRMEEIEGRVKSIEKYIKTTEKFLQKKKNNKNINIELIKNKKNALHQKKRRLFIQEQKNTTIKSR